MSAPSIVVRRASGLVTVQDAGRPGFMHLGIPPGGPLAPSRFTRANRAVGNATDAAALEVIGVLEIESDRDVRVSVDGAPAITLAPHAPLRVTSTSTSRVRYVAFAGGIDVPTVFGGRGTLLVASLGGIEGRAVRADDHLALALALAPAPAQDLDLDLDRDRDRDHINVDVADVVRVIVGPDLDALAAGAFDALCASTFHVSTTSDRVGARLEGGRVISLPLPPGARRPSAPMVRGAIQVPPDGQPIVLGPDHPTTGGYPIVGVVVSDDVERVVAASIGARVRFRAVRS